MKKLVIFFVILNAMLLTQTLQAKEWAFDVYLDKSKIGQHRFTLNNQNELTSKADFKVKVLFINAYQYEHQATETWSNDCLQTLKAHTVEKKIITDIGGQLNNGQFLVEDGKTTQSLPSCVMTFAYWNPKMLSQTKLLNPQNGEWLDTAINKLDDEIITVKGRKVKTSHYSLKASLAGKNKLNISLWYDEHNDWVALQSITPEGYTISYHLK